MPSITDQSAWAEASHVILLISGSDYFLIKAELMKKRTLTATRALHIYIYTHIYAVISQKRRFITKRTMKCRLGKHVPTEGERGRHSVGRGKRSVQAGRASCWRRALGGRASRQRHAQLCTAPRYRFSAERGA